MASAHCGSVPVDTGRIAERASVLDRNHQNRAIPTPRFARKSSTWNSPSHAEGTYRQNCTIHFLGITISELHFKDEFQDRSMLLFRLSYDRDVVDPRSRGGGKSVDDLMKSQSIGEYVFPMFEMLDAKIATALKRIISNQYFRRSINVE